MDVVTFIILVVLKVIHIYIDFFKKVRNLGVLDYVISSRDIETLVMHLDGLLSQVPQWFVGTLKQLLSLESHCATMAALTTQFQLKLQVLAVERTLDINNGVHFM